MTTITIKDLCVDRELDRQARLRIKGGGAPWVFGIAVPYGARPSGSDAVTNLYETNNYFIADQMNNQFSVIDVKNTAPNAVINVDAAQKAGNLKVA
jgi:hypothetical protein